MSNKYVKLHNNIVVDIATSTFQPTGYVLLDPSNYNVKIGYTYNNGVYTPLSTNPESIYEALIALISTKVNLDFSNADITGIRGEKGDTIHVLANLDNNVGVNGDLLITIDDYNIYLKESNTYVLKGNIKGNKGDKGDAANLWHSGNGLPNDQDGNELDYYIDLDTSNIYKKLDGIYVFQSELKGLTGDQGIQGETGVSPVTYIHDFDNYVFQNGLMYIGQSINLEVDDATAFASNMTVFIKDCGYFTVDSTSDNVLLSVTFIKDLNGQGTCNIAVGQLISIAGYKGDTGNQGIQGEHGINAITTITDFDGSLVGSYPYDRSNLPLGTVVITDTPMFFVEDATAFSVGMDIFIQECGYFTITNVYYGQNAIEAVFNQGINGYITAELSNGRVLTPLGLKGLKGDTGLGVTTTYTGGEVNYNNLYETNQLAIGDGNAIFIGSHIFIEERGYFVVTNKDISGLFIDAQFVKGISGSTNCNLYGNEKIVVTGALGSNVIATVNQINSQSSYGPITIGDTVSVVINDGRNLVTGLDIFIQDSGYFTVTETVDPSGLFILTFNRGIDNNPHCTINANSAVLTTGMAGLYPSGNGIGGTNHIYVTGNYDATYNGIELANAYNAAKAMMPYGEPISYTNRVTIVVGPGIYDTTLNIDTAYVDVVSLTGKADVNLSGIYVTTDSVYLKGLNLGSNPFTIEGWLHALKCEDCIGGNNSFGWSVPVTGTFINCRAGDNSYGYGSLALGKFTNCIGGMQCFGSYGQADGTFINCSAQNTSFGGATYNGLYNKANGIFINCDTENYSFGSYGDANGTFVNCSSFSYSYGYYGTCGGLYNNCKAGTASYGSGGVLSGKLLFCTTSGSFITPTDPGKVISCIDSTNLIVNLPVVIGGGGGSGPGIEGVSYIYVTGAGTAVDNGIELMGTYSTAKDLTPYNVPLSTTNRVKILIGAGQYDISNFEIDAQFIDFYSLSGDSDVHLTSVNVTANDVHLKGLNLGINPFTIGNNLSLLKCENCVGGNDSFGGSYSAIAVSGTFINCTGGDWSFAGSGIASGIFIGCTGDLHCFGNNGTASGKFTNCIGNSQCFGNQGNASGIFTNCTAGNESFGYQGNLNGILTNCIVTSGTFITPTGNGKVINSIDSNYNVINLPIVPVKGAIEGNNHIYVKGNSSDATINGAELTAAYTAAKAMAPYGSVLSNTNRVKIIIGPGTYNTTLNIDTQYIDLVSLTGNADVMLSGINVTANDVYLKGFNLGTNSFNISNNLNLLKCENCVGGDRSFGYNAAVSGTFINCVGGTDSWGSPAFSGILKNCTFMSATYPTIIGNGKIINCIDSTGNLINLPVGIITGTVGGINHIYVQGKDTAANNFTALSAAYTTAKSMTPYGNAKSATNRVKIIVAPGSYDGTLTVDTQYVDIVSLTGNPDVFLSGISVTGNDIYLKGLNLGSNAFTIASNLSLLKCENCSTTSSLGNGVTLSGIFINCTADNGSFGSVASGTFINCTAGDVSFGAGTMGGTASGTFTNCTARGTSFGSCIYSGMGNAIASGTFINCTAGDNSFAGNNNSSITSGIFTNCTAGSGSFGTFGSATLTGILRECFKTSGSFPNVSGNGKVISSIDGTNAVINLPIIPVVGVVVGTSYIFVQGNDTAANNFTALTTAYTTAKSMTPYGNAKSATNRVKIIVGPGSYGGTLTVDTQYIDFVSLSGNSDVYLTGINVTANDVYLKGLNTRSNPFTIATSLNLLVCENCGGGNQSFGYNLSVISGTFINCIGGNNSFSADTTSGTFTNCTAGNASFSGNGSGVFTNCVSGTYSFGYNATSTVAGTFTNCTASTTSFAGNGGNLTGVLNNCKADSNSFGGSTGTITGILKNCTLTSGTFITPTGNGKVINSIDGNNNLINLPILPKLKTFKFIATAGQATFSGADANGVTLSYVVGNIFVTLNGLILIRDVDYTAINGISIVLTEAAVANDEMLIMAIQ